MPPSRFWALLLPIACAYAAGDARSTPQIAQDVQRNASRLPAPLAHQFRMEAAQALVKTHPELARKFLDVTLKELGAASDVEVPSSVVRALAALVPDEAISTLPKASPGSISTLIGALAQSDRADSALTLYRSALAEKKVDVRAAAPLIGQLARAKPGVAGQLFQESVAAFSFDNLEPWDAWWLITTAGSAAAASPTAAADLYERILTVASAPGYGEKSKSSITATFQLGSATVTTTNSRETLLLAAAGRLHALAPQRLEKFKALLAPWDLTGPVTVRGYNMRPPGAPLPNADTASASASVRKNLSQFRGLPSDADRARLALASAALVRSLPGGSEKLGLAQSLCNLSTEGDLGIEALTAVSKALAQALRETKAESGAWLQLAQLIRYEHVPAPYSDPALDAAASILALRETVAQESGFSLTGLDGKIYSLSSLRGRVVLLNFWATWCPPCRKEMPDMEKLYHQFEKKGFTVLAVSDETREVVTGFLQKQNYTFPVLLDPDRRAHAAFGVEGIPKSFLFDREGRLVTQSIDMRTERQFLQMLKQVGLE